MALKWSQVYVLNTQDKEVHGPSARDYVQSTKPGLIRQTSFKEAVVLEAKGKAVTENEAVKQMLREAFPNRVRFMGDPALKGVPLPVRKGMENVLVAPIPDKKKAQFIGFNVRPAIGQFDLITGTITSASDKTGEYRGPRSKSAKPNDLGNRCKIMTDAIKAAAKSGKIDKADTVLKVFMAPEFFYRGYDGGYPIEKISTIMDEMRKETANAAYKDWVFVFGTAIGYLKHADSGGNTKFALKLTKIEASGPKAILHITHLDAPASPDKGRDQAAVCERIQQNAEPLFRWKVAQKSNNAESDVLLTQCANKERDEYLMLIDDGTGFQVGPIDLVEPISTEVFNVALIQKGGPEPTGKPAGLRDAIVYKEYVSAIDFIGPQYGEHAKFHDPTGLHRSIKITRKLERVLPTEGSVDVLSAKANLPGTTGEFKNLSGDVKTYRISEVSKTGLGGGSVFTIDGVTFGVEVCLDHAKAKLSGFFSSGQALSGEPYPQVQLIPSWGMSITPSCIACPTGGLIFNVDGSRGDSTARINDSKYSCVAHPLVAETVVKPCPHKHYFCVGDPHEAKRAAVAGPCPTCGDAMATVYHCDGSWQAHPGRFGDPFDACPTCGEAMAEAYYCKGTAAAPHASRSSHIPGSCTCGQPYELIGWCGGRWVPHAPAVNPTPAACPTCATAFQQIHYCEGTVPHDLEFYLGPSLCTRCGAPARPWYSCSGKATHACALSTVAGPCGCGRPFKEYQSLLAVPLGTGIAVADGPTDVSLSSGLEWQIYYEGKGQVVIFEATDIPPSEFVS
jgi:hypothetical protein